MPPNPLHWLKLFRPARKPNMSSTQPTGPAAELRALSDLIKASVDKIEALCAERGQTFPLSDLPFTPQSEAPRMAPDVIAEGTIIVAAAAQLIAAVRPPPLGLLTYATQYHVSSCVRASIRLHVAEILREAGPKGLHVNEIAKPTNVDPAKLARILRVLATKHIYKEVAPDTFANNRLSSLMDTGKPIADILAKPDEKHDNTPGIAALLEHTADTGYYSSYYLSDVLLDPKWSHSAEPNEAALNMAFKTTLPGFEWTALPENSHRRKLLGIGMRGLQGNPEVVLNGFDWQNLPSDSVVVDVGGGIGSKMLPLAKKFEHLKFIIQDREDVIPNTTEFWNANLPQALSSGRVKVQAHDFFNAQPIQKPAVFYLCTVLHDWSDKYCIKILTQLRAAAGPDTQLVIMDNIISYASPQYTLPKEVPGATTPAPPEPLLPNGGEANIMPYLADMQMLAGLNGSERTVMQYDHIFEASGWKLTKVYTGNGFQSQDSKIIGVPL